MATRYWDYGTDTSNWTDTSTSTASTSDWYWVTSTADTTTTASQPQPRRIIVEAPSYWDKIAKANFTKLMNEQTRTGWKLLMWIEGNIDIVDPSIETRTMKEFVPLFKRNGSEADRSLIDEFMDKYGIE